MIELSANVKVRLTTAERDLIPAPLAGMTIYNTTLDVVQNHNGSNWVDTGGDISSTTTFIKAGLMGFFSSDLPTDTKIIFMQVEEDLIYEANAPQSSIKALVVPTANLVIPIRRLSAAGVDTSIGSITIDSTTGIGAVSLAAITIATGDSIYLVTPADTLGCADLFLNLTGKSLLPLY